MGGAIVTALLNSVPPCQIIVTDHQIEKAATFAEEHGTQLRENNAAAVEAADYIFLCVKPQTCAVVVGEIAAILRASAEKGRPKVLCSILAGVSIKGLRALIGVCDYPILRMMPNTPILIGEGMILLAADDALQEEDRENLMQMLTPCGGQTWVGEDLFDQATVVSGCAPAFAYQFIDALAEGGVMQGLGQKEALVLAAKAVLGAASMVLHTGQSPKALIDMVTSPGGSTIEGVRVFEAAGLADMTQKAVEASYKRNVALGEVQKESQ